MKRFLKIQTGGVIFSTDTITKEDLLRARNSGGSYIIIDLDIGTAYDPDNNKWVHITVMSSGTN